jgi:hypothetical protein
MIRRYLVNKATTHTPRKRFETATMKDYLLGLGVGSLLGLYGGWKISYTDDLRDWLTPFECEDQIYHLLDTYNKPVITLLYIPGEIYFIPARFELMKLAKKYSSDVSVMLINCRTHYDYCKKREFDRVIFMEMHMPKEEVPSPKVKYTYPVIPVSVKPTGTGFQYFLEREGIIKEKNHAVDFYKKLF